MQDLIGIIKIGFEGRHTDDYWVPRERILVSEEDYDEFEWYDTFAQAETFAECFLASLLSDIYTKEMTLSEWVSQSASGPSETGHLW